MFINRFFTSLLFILLALPALAQDSPVPERRSIAFENSDFFGGDIRTILETTLEICEAACINDANCRALTFNEKAGACFLKNTANERSYFEGALSLQLVESPTALRETARTRLPDLDFLPDGYIPRATRRAERIGLEYRVNDIGLSEIELRLQSSMESFSFISALDYAGKKLSLDDSADAWLFVATLAAKMAEGDSAFSSTRRSLARDSAINAYLRSSDNEERATAMELLGRLLEVADYGRQSIDAFRLAQSLSPSDTRQAALDRAIGLFGFRVTDHQVDNNAERPRICLNFNERLSELGVDYANFVRLGSGNLPVEVEGEQLCIDGVTHGETYEITLREGLPAASEETLTKSMSVSVYVRDRDPAVHFIGRSYVLPMGDNPSIPVTSVNADDIELRLFRIDERNLVPSLSSEVAGNPLDEYSENDIAESRGEELWRGIGEVQNTLNANVITALPLAPALQEFSPGIYAMTARIAGSSEPWEEASTQWFIVTDMGLETILAADGLHVFARSLRNALPLENVKARLIANNNTMLFEARTDSRGYLQVPEGYTLGEGGQSPAMLQLQSDSGDFAFIDLNEGAMDLSDRGVEGRPAPGNLDIFASFERGAYRPGETVYATILARDSNAIGVEGLPLTAILYRPDGVEHSRDILHDLAAGGRVYQKPLSNTAMRGTWMLQVHADPEEPSLKTIRFLVEDFIPERIDFDLAIGDENIRLEDSPNLEISATYLYGAPAAGLGIEGDIQITAETHISAYPGYEFGLSDEPFIEGYAPISADSLTDENGALALALTLPDMEPVTQPMKMRATVRMSDGSGRPVERSITRALLPDGSRIGIKPLFEGSLREGAEAAFEIIAVDRDINRTDMPNVGWTLSRVERHYQWYRYNGRWNWEPVTRRVRVASGEIDLLNNTPIRIGANIDWGRYELKLVHSEPEYTASSFAFNSGWWSADAGSDTPDVLDVSLDKARYEIGETAQLRVTPRTDGKMLVRVVSDRLISMQAVDVEAGEQLVQVPVEEDWGPGAYIVATLIQPMDELQSRNPARSIGLAYAPTNPGSRDLSASFDMPTEITPRGPLEARIKIDNAPAGETVYATIAAVDVGILNLTNFQSPNPSEYYFGQRRLGVEFRDIYGRLIDGMQGTPGLLRSGGDGALARVNAPPPTQDLIAYFSGPIKVGADGYATADFDLPAFNGTVRLMAVVWSKSSIGEAEFDLLVRDPIVVSTAFPRFLAPGDETRLRVDVANVKGPAGMIEISVDTEGGLSVPQNLSVQNLSLNIGDQAALEFPIRAGEVGDSEISVTATVSDGSQFIQTFPVSIRANDPPIVRDISAPLSANGGTFIIAEEVFHDLQPGTGEGSVAYGPLARFNVAGMLSALDKTPWGGTETRISRAMPLLYLSEIATAMDLDGDYDSNIRVSDAIALVLSNQTSRGSFGQWRPRSGDLWLDAFASDFLSRARIAGHQVPDRAFTSALQNLRNELNYAGDFENAGQDIAYALMVLAREGQASIGDLRYYADVKADEFATPMALAQLGAALAYIGDQTRADILFAKAYERVRKSVEDLREYRSDYGSHHRDMAALLALAVESRSTAVDVEALTKRIITPKRYYSSQERLWQLLAARALISDVSEDIFVDGLPLTGPQMVYFDSLSLAVAPIEMQNNSNRQIDGLLSVTGAPSFDLPPESNGYRIERWLYTLDGDLADFDNIAQNERYVSILRVTPEQERRGQLIISDPLAAGFEIDNPNLLRSGDISSLDWLQLDDGASATEFRDDRFVSAIDWGKKGSLQLAYIVRAVSPGRFRQPAAHVEDMYRPSLRANTGVNYITILPSR